jgi:cysteinyl-tRNA synthetase
MSINLYNTLTRHKEEFKTINPGSVGMYCCGPTVYWYQHIGNFRAYITWDILKRTLSHAGLKVLHVMNYTDVGHLTSDADEGEDKMESAARKEGKSAAEIASFYAQAFEEDEKKLNIIPPDVICKATEHIAEQIALVKTLEIKGFTYRTSDGIYFDTSKFPDYGRLGKINAEGLEAGTRVDMGEKKNKTDFALWKFSGKPGVRQQEWDSPWGLGFPGWHIECSAMSSKYLGQQFDIHTGGEDHIQVHHQNEIAQSEAAFGKKPWVNYWLHVAFLTFKGEKVSKSKGGLFTVSELEKLGFRAMDYRYFCLGTHYRKPLGFSIEALEGAKNTFTRLQNSILELRRQQDSKTTGATDGYRDYFKRAIEDDLNTPLALAALWNMLKDERLGSVEKLELAYEFDTVLGFGLERLDEERPDIPEEVMALGRNREEARRTKQWALSDKLRDQIKEKGFIVEDTKDGQKIRKQ